MFPLLKEFGIAALEWLMQRFLGRKAEPEQVSVETYEAKTAEAKELARPDDSWRDVTDRL